MEDLVANQQQIISGIEQLFTNFKKDGADRKTADYIKRRLETLDSYWKEVQSNHLQLCGFGAKGHPYFTTRKFDLAKERYETIRSAIENYQTESRPSTPIIKPATSMSFPGTSFQPSPSVAPLQSYGTSSKTEEMLRKQASNFRAFQRAITGIDLEAVSEKWEFEDILQTIQSRWSVIDKLHWELDSELEGSNQEYENAYSNYEQSYSNIKRAINKKMWSLAHRVKSTPKMEIPYFNGNYHQWTSFKDLFVETVHNNPSLSNAQKMQFLKGKVKGEAEKMIQHLNISSDNYEVCWNILNHRFNNKKLIFSSHINLILNIPIMQHPSLNLIKRIHDTTIEGLNAIKNLGVDVSTWDPLMVHILCQKLDSDTHNDYIESLKQPREIPKLQDFLDFLELKFTSLESSRKKQEPQKPTAYNNNQFGGFKNHNQKYGNNYKTSFTSNNHRIVSQSPSNKITDSSKYKCPLCKNYEHGLYYCTRFLEMSLNDKLKTIKNLKLCENCLFCHNEKACYSDKRCRECNGQHNTLLHDAFVQGSSSTQNTSNKEVTENAKREHKLTSFRKNSYASQSDDPPEVLLPTAIIKVQSANGLYHKMRILLDQGSQASLITENAAQLLQLHRVKCSGSITGVGAKISNCKGMIKIKCASVHNDYVFETNVLIMNQLINSLPSNTFSKPTWEFDNMALADADFNISRPVDILLGADIYSQVLLEGIHKFDSSITAQYTRLGWILSGNVKPLHCNVILNNLDDIQRFWSIEDVPEDINMSAEDCQCVQLYESTTTRQADGRYVVRLPMHPQADETLGLSKCKAVAQFYQLERKFKKQVNIAQGYQTFIKEYISFGHMHPTKGHIPPSYYLPHHCVLRTDSTTTALRVVFNASQKTTSGLSLNDVMYRGPNLQQDLLLLVLKWRQYPYAFTADIEKMFRQIIVHPDDRRYQMIVWRDAPQQPLQDYQLATVTYGTKPAPFLAMMTLKRLAKDERHQFPVAAKVLEEQFYMDDLLSGSYNIISAKQLQADLLAICKSGGFNLRKWSSNEPQLVQNVHEATKNQETFDFKNQESTKALGLSWNSKQDTFTFLCKMSKQTSARLTKRTLLSEISKIFDPLGWLAPVIVQLKLLFQAVWLLNLKWDDKVPDDIHSEWLKLRASIEYIGQIKIQRWIGSKEKDIIQLHGFCDASRKAYACVVYARIQQQNKISVTLLTAKTKLVPVSKKSCVEVSLPRLELSGADLLSKLMIKVAKSLGTHNLEIYGWCDSTAVLGWLQGEPNRWKPFVANRVRNITETMKPSCWRYVKSGENPADCASRGLTVKQLQNHALWWNGPSWLSMSKQLHQIIPAEFNTDLEVNKSKQVNVAIGIDNSSIIKSIISKYNSFNKATRILAWILRSISRHLNLKKHIFLTTQDLQIARIKIMKHVQSADFTEEISSLQNHGKISSKSKLSQLNPFLDTNGLLRVGGRLRNSHISEDMKYPIIIAHNGQITNQLIDLAHKSTFHGGARLTLAWLRQQYWIIGGNIAVKKRLRGCVVCRKHNPSKHYQIMGDLPEARVNPTRPFHHTGVDFTGYVDIKASKGRGIKTSKGYIAVFVCMVTKAVHLELVSDLSSSAFLAALRRLSARKGTPRHIYSDNGTNFVGASRVLKNEYINLKSIFSNDFHTSISEMQIEWHFNAPSWPSAGGLWEAAVKSLKHHLRRVVGEQKLTYEEFSTVLSQLEACLNSRPLCAISEDPNDIDFLTPSHFLASGPILTVVETERDERTRWQLTQRIFNDIWKRWRNEYLTQLSPRSKWQYSKENIKINDIVIIHEDNLPAGKWALGRVVDIHPGKDGYVRVVSVKTKNSVIKRPIVKLTILPVNTGRKDQPNKSQSASTETASSKKKTISNIGIKHSFMSAILLLFMMLFISNVDGAYNISKLSSSQAIYFDKIQNMHLIRDEWNLIVYYEMNPYWDGFVTFTKYTKYLEHLCTSIKENSHCADVLSFLRHDLTELQYYNQMLLDQQYNARSRSRRGLINGIGYVANSLFGVLDERFAEKYEQDINLLRKSDYHMTQLWKNQTSVVEAQFNLLKRMEVIMEKHHKQINSKLINIENSLQTLKTKVEDNSVMSDFMLTSFIAKDILANLKYIQDNILDTVTNIFNGKVNFHLLSPDQLRNELNVISGQLSKEYSLPMNNNHLTNIYNLLKIRARITKNYIMFEIKIPLIGRDRYEIFKMIPVPKQVGGQIINVVTISEYAAINLEKDTLLPMSEKDISLCLEQDYNMLLCYLRSPEYHIKDDASMCKTISNSSTCKTVKQVCTDRWTELNSLGTYLYYCCDACHMKLICDDQVTGLQLTHAGLLSVGHGCLIKTKEFSVYTHKRDSTKVVLKPELLTPEIAQINHFINITLPEASLADINSTDVQNHHERLLEIEKQIEFMKQEVPLAGEISYSDIHHFTVIYIIVGVLFIIGTITVWRKVRTCRLSQPQQGQIITQPMVTLSAQHSASVPCVRETVQFVSETNLSSACVNKATSPMFVKCNFKKSESL